MQVRPAVGQQGQEKRSNLSCRGKGLGHTWCDGLAGCWSSPAGRQAVGGIKNTSFLLEEGETPEKHLLNRFSFTVLMDLVDK